MSKQLKVKVKCRSNPNMDVLMYRASVGNSPVHITSYPLMNNQVMKASIRHVYTMPKEEMKTLTLDSLVACEMFRWPIRKDKVTAIQKILTCIEESLQAIDHACSFSVVRDSSETGLKLFMTVQRCSISSMYVSRTFAINLDIE